MPTPDRYQLLDVLGQGGMAVVYRAYDTRLQREIALKLLAAHLITESAFYQRFEREARIVATLEHPSIVPIYDFGIDDNRQPYLVMRLLRGGTLRDRRARGELNGADLWPPMRQVAAALDYAHSLNIVHRDIKPVNILFDEKGNAYVSDFGIAKVRDTTTSDLTGNNVLGTPAYMSPEQFDVIQVDGRCDQYSLAVVLFEALTGRLPFAGKTPNVLMNQHLNEAPVAFGLFQQAIAYDLNGLWQIPVQKRCAIAQCPGFLLQHRQVMPRIADQLLAPEAAGMDGHDFAFVHHADLIRCPTH